MTFANMRRSTEQNRRDLTGCLKAFAIMFVTMGLIVGVVCWWRGW